MGLTPSRNPYPTTNNSGATGTVTSPTSITTKGGVVTSVDSTAASATPSQAQTAILANAPLNLAGGTLTLPQATATSDGYLSSGNYTAFASVSTWGTLASRPVTPVTIGNQAPIYFAVDVLTVFIWAGAWYTLAVVAAPSISSSSSSSSSSM